MDDLEQILERKARLRSAILRQRGRLARQARDLQPLFTGADRMTAVARSVRTHPLWLAAGAAVLMAMLTRRRPARREGGIAVALRWAKRGLFAWRTGSWAWNLMQGMGRKT